MVWLQILPTRSPPPNFLTPFMQYWKVPFKAQILQGRHSPPHPSTSRVVLDLGHTVFSPQWLSSCSLPEPRAGSHPLTVLESLLALKRHL